jgi:hypothetical protein
MMPGDMSLGAAGVGVALRPVGVAMLTTLAVPRLRKVRSLPIEP